MDVAMAIAAIAAVPFVVPYVTSQPLTLAVGDAMRERFMDSLSSISPPFGDPKTWWFLPPEHVRGGSESAWN